MPGGACIFTVTLAADQDKRNEGVVDILKSRLKGSTYMKPLTERARLYEARSSLRSRWIDERSPSSRRGPHVRFTMEHRTLQIVLRKLWASE